jgi:heat shock protein HspQ
VDDSTVPDYFPDRLPRFEPGRLVRHKRYGYLGVVVDFDMRCQAPDSWYLANRTQPDRNQPWYHVLVDQTDRVTYAAEESLSADQLGQPIQHPLLDQLFIGFDSGNYRRNDMPWPSH